MSNRVIAAVLGAAALAVPAAAGADSGRDKAHEKHAAKQVAKAKKPKTVMFVFKGSFTAPGTVEVVSGNAHVKKGGFVGQAVTFDLASAKVVAADANADQKVDLADVADGDLVRVQARAVKGTRYAAPAAAESAAPIVARKLIDKTNAPLSD